ncbi:iron transporter [Gordonia spumicola]|uniref:Iron transporter n=1 Tax=Gordonia spumicola TaxID=589161 RepID=A0A7I9V5B6_9ACTN|nr:iron transporter [Gordonia spumicola]
MHGRRRQVPAAGFLLCATTALTVAACSTGAEAGDQAGAVSDAGYPVTVQNCGFTEKFVGAPERVMILSGASVGEAETMIELDLGSAVLANAQKYGVSDIPGMVEKVAALPTDGLKLNDSADITAEQILARRPDLVISTWSGGFDPKYGGVTRENLAAAGIRTLVNPVNCAYGKAADVTPEETKAYETASVESSFDFVRLLGAVFGVPDKAKEVVDALKQKLETTADMVSAQHPRKKMLLAFPDMSAMNSNGLPAVMSGGIYDAVIRSAGGEPTFADGGPSFTSGLSAEQLASADVDVLVLGKFRPETDLSAEAQRLFAAYPQWSASKTKTYVAVSDGAYIGPANAYAVEKIAAAAYPDAN